MALKTEVSGELFERARRILPGGVSSPVRAFRHVGGTPLFIRSGSGARIEDEDGNAFIDLCQSWGALALGHAHPAVTAAISGATAQGTTFGTPTRREVELAERISRLHPAAERVRFVSSGTEAVMSAVRVARGATGRDLVLKFDGCYHGHADYLLVRAGSGLATSGIADSAGVPAAIAGTTAVLPLDDLGALEAFMRERGREVAAILIEGVPANAGLLVQRPEFMAALREEASRAGALLIVDEVITGFRLGRGGASARYGVRPDLVTFGKVIGGGLPVGAYAGRRELLEQVAPLGPIYQAGTLSGNPVAMAAGAAALEVLERGGFERLDERARALDAALRPVIERAPGGPMTLVREGPIFWITFQGPAPRAYDRIDRPRAAARYAKLHRAMLERGVYLPPSAFEVFFATTALADEDIARTAEAFASAFAEIGKEAAS